MFGCTCVVAYKTDDVFLVKLHVTVCILHTCLLCLTAIKVEKKRFRISAFLSCLIKMIIVYVIYCFYGR